MTVALVAVDDVFDAEEVLALDAVTGAAVVAAAEVVVLFTDCDGISAFACDVSW